MIENLKELTQKHPKHKIIFYLKGNCKEDYNNIGQKIDFLQNGYIQIFSKEKVIFFNSADIISIHFEKQY